jgi:hypothetical protein
MRILRLVGMLGSLAGAFMNYARFFAEAGSSGWIRTYNPPVNSSDLGDPLSVTKGDEDPDDQ